MINIESISIVLNIIAICIEYMAFIYIIKKAKDIHSEKLNLFCIIVCILSNLIIFIINTLPSLSVKFRGVLYGKIMSINHMVSPKLTLLSSVLLIIIVLKAIEDMKIKNEKNRLKDKVDMQYNYYMNLVESQNKIKRLYHDLNNHILCIKAMNEDKENVNEYIDSITNEMKDFKNIHTSENIILDIIMEETKSKCEKKNIEFSYNINFSKCDFIEMIDVCSVFSNILDNAIEACDSMNCDGKYIKLRGTIVQSYYVVKCENSKSNKLKKVKNRIITSKKDKFIHGIGLKSVEASLEKYEGELKLDDLENRFIAKIYIPIKDKRTYKLQSN